MNWLDKPIFKKPKWLKPELDRPWYYVHVVILVVTILLILKYWFGHDMLTMDWVVKISIAAIVADTVAHTTLQRD